MKIHLIAIGGAVMHNLAMALHNKGVRVTGSDDEIFEPSRSRLERYGLLPKKTGWDPTRITSDLDGVILGMHARKDNPELARAQELGLKIWSFPEYIYEHSKEKMRVVVGGSHGKTTVTSMIMHVLWFNHRDFDYMVGSQLEGFETMVSLTKEAPLIILEGDEYLSSPIDPRPKFHLYYPHIAVITGIAWDHMNVFPTFENYLVQFRIFAKKIDPEGKLFWFSGDDHLRQITGEADCETEAYEAHPYKTEHGKALLVTDQKEIPIPVFGQHNMQNIQAALMVCRSLGLTDEQFYEAIPSFRGAAKRQELLASSESKKVYLDFAHAPSKVKATLQGFREQYPHQYLVACLELHTFSSLNREFIPQYAGTMAQADRAIVFYNPAVVRHKKLPPVSENFIRKCFERDNLEVISDPAELHSLVSSFNDEGIYLFMSSGNFSGMDMKKIARELI